jgi:L-ascorbate metabolism protein UlaG (beta-lactamase superfamily)
MQAIYHGHSFIEIETEQGSILIDPFVTGNPKCNISLEDVFSKKITHILLTHGHHDHVGDTIEIAKNIPNCVVVGMVELIDWLETKGITSIHSLNI